MRVTLKRANFYERAAEKAAKDPKYRATLSVSIYAPVMNTHDTALLASEIAAAQSKVLDDHQLALDLNRARYAIRRQLAEANAQHGVSLMLTQNKELEFEESHTRALIKVIEGSEGAEKSVEAALAKAKSLRETPADAGYLGRRDNSVEMDLFSQPDLDRLRRQLKRIVDRRGGLNDALTALNVTHTVVLEQPTVETLRKADILAD